MEWYYLDRQDKEFGPFKTKAMRAWERHGFFHPKLLVRPVDGLQFERFRS